MPDSLATPTPPSIVIVGAGLAGLCLAQALMSAGIDVQVYERDQANSARRQGYRITLDRHGLAALRACLPPQLFELAVATKKDSGGYFRYTNSDLRDIFKLTFKPDPESGGQVDRQTLHAILRTGLEDRIHFGKTAIAVEGITDGAAVRFSDGTELRANLVVASDGINSALRPQIASNAAPSISPYVGVYGVTYLPAGAPSFVPEALSRSGVLALADAPGRAFFFTTMRFHERPDVAFTRLAPDTTAPINDDYVMWGLVSPSSEAPEAAVAADPVRLHAQAVDFAKQFHPVLHTMVAAGDPAQTIMSRFSAGRRPTHWTQKHATLMGDAIHPMPPFGAHGGNTALRDAALLANELRTALREERPIETAIDPYQRSMSEYAFKAVATAERSMRQLSMNPLQRWFMLKVLTRFNRMTVPVPK
jgi:2-polyprenyl-6-methoxyphenol hydroxylase-like FAD-dependent oxidoreductase